MNRFKNTIASFPPSVTALCFALLAGLLACSDGGAPEDKETIEKLQKENKAIKAENGPLKVRDIQQTRLIKKLKKKLAALQGGTAPIAITDPLVVDPAAPNPQPVHLLGSPSITPKRVGRVPAFAQQRAQIDRVLDPVYRANNDVELERLLMEAHGDPAQASAIALLTRRPDEGALQLLQAVFREPTAAKEHKEALARAIAMHPRPEGVAFLLSEYQDLFDSGQWKNDPPAVERMKQMLRGLGSARHQAPKVAEKLAEIAHAVGPDPGRFAPAALDGLSRLPDPSGVRAIAQMAAKVGDAKLGPFITLLAHASDPSAVDHLLTLSRKRGTDKNRRLFARALGQAASDLLEPVPGRSWVRARPASQLRGAARKAKVLTLLTQQLSASQGNPGLTGELLAAISRIENKAALDLLHGIATGSHPAPIQEEAARQWLACRNRILRLQD